MVGHDKNKLDGIFFITKDIQMNKQILNLKYLDFSSEMLPLYHIYLGEIQLSVNRKRTSFHRTFQLNETRF